MLATEAPFQAEVELPDGQRVVLHGYADRLELDHEGRVVVVDLKTGKDPVSGADLAVHPQLGLYQLAVEHGALDAARRARRAGPPPAESGGAELWQLAPGRRPAACGCSSSRPSSPTTTGTAPVERQLHGRRRRGCARSASRRAPGEPLLATATSRRLCPAQIAGTVLS